MASWFDELAQFLRIESVSADPAAGAEVDRAGRWVSDFIAAAGGSSELIDWHGQPLVVGELRASAQAEHAPTILCYGHFDVQPADPLELWESPPFEPEIRGEYLYGRGVADDKGQLYMLLAGARELAEANRLAVNVRFVCDGEEETGGNAIVEFLAADRRGADAAVIFDSGMVARGVPAFDIATRGMAYFHLKLRTGARDLHSGLFGGSALNAAHAMIRMLDALIAVDGRLAEPLREGIIAPTDAELESWRALPSGRDELAAQGARPMDPAAAEQHYLRTFAEPALDVNGIQSGSPHAIKTVLPVEAVANVSLRLAPGQEPARISEPLKRCCAAAPAGSELEIESLASAAPGIVAPDSPAIELGLRAFERVLGARPLLIRSGGSLPLVPALAAKGIPTIITGFALPDANIHAPNERLLADYVALGIETARALFEEFAALAG